MPTYQSDGTYGGPGGGDGGGSIFGRQLLLLLMVSVGGILLYKNCDSAGGLSNLFSSSKEVKLTYVESNFQPNLDEEATLRILSDPQEYKREFNELVYNFNVSLLYHIANRMALPDSLRHQLEPEYSKHHEYLKTMYYNDFTAIKDTTASMYENWYNDNANNAVQLFNEVAGKYTCFFVTQIMATLIRSDNGRLMARGKQVETPCGIAINEGLRPLVNRLQKKAEIMDFSASRGMLKDKIKRGITELATYEIRSRLGIDKELQYKILGIAVSTTDLRVEAISVIKAGFKLDQSFDITMSPKKGIVFVTLPEPTILSHEVYPKVDKLDVGFLAGISGEEMNRNFNELRRQFRDDAINNDKILDKAKMRVDSVMQLMLGPVVRSINRNYKLQMRFTNGSPAPSQQSRSGADDPPPPRVGSPPPVDAPKPKSKTGVNTQ